MQILEDLVKTLSMGGYKKVEADVLIDVPYEASCYKVGDIIRIDLKKKKSA
jgi:hypothetical protein